MEKKDERAGLKPALTKEENWLDDLMEIQKHDLEEEEEKLSSVPKRIRTKWIDIDDE